MTDNNPQWERDLVTNLATAALKEQRRARRCSLSAAVASLVTSSRSH